MRETGFFTNSPPPSYVVAETDCVFYRISRADLHELKRQNPALSSFFYEMLAKLLAERLAKQNKMIELLTCEGMYANTLEKK